MSTELSYETWLEMNKALDELRTSVELLEAIIRNWKADEAFDAELAKVAKE